MEKVINSFWDQFESWEAAELAWDKGVQEIKEELLLEPAKIPPNMVGITPSTAKGLKWKGLKYMVQNDRTGKIRSHFFEHPIKYGKNFLKSLCSSRSMDREGDFFLYGLQNLEEFESLLLDKDTVFVLGYSYCHKPHECPSKRFTDECIRDSNNPICRQCFIGKSLHALPKKNSEPIIIKTIHHIGEKIFEVVHNLKPNQKVAFLISACELCLTMFADWGNMVEIKGIGVRLDGRICNTMPAFHLSEEGIKPGLTAILPETQQQILDWIKLRRTVF